MSFRFSFLLMVSLSSAPSALQAEITLPSCERLEKFHLDYFRTGTPEDIFETFGTDPRNITDADIDTIDALIVECALRAIPGEWAGITIDDEWTADALRINSKLKTHLMSDGSIMDQREAVQRREDQLILDLRVVLESIPEPEDVGRELYRGIDHQQARHMDSASFYLSSRPSNGETATPLIAELLDAIKLAERAAVQASYIAQLERIEASIPSAEAPNEAVWHGLTEEDAKLLNTLRYSIEIDLQYFDGASDGMLDIIQDIISRLDAIKLAELLAVKASYISQLERIEVSIPSVEAPNVVGWPGLTEEDNELRNTIRHKLSYSEINQIDTSDITRLLNVIDGKRQRALAVRSEEEIISEGSELPARFEIFYLIADFCMQNSVSFNRRDLPILRDAFENMLTLSNTSDAARELGQRNARRAFDLNGAQYRITMDDCIDLRKTLAIDYGISF